VITLRRADWLFVLAVGLLILFISMLPSPRQRNPPIPGTPEHQGVSEKQCSSCHKPAGVYPLAARHPKRQDCFRCHRPSEDVRRKA
jgi:predicted CXXCH cytochrome family protein